MFRELQNTEQDAVGSEAGDQNNFLGASHLRCRCCENPISSSLHLINTYSQPVMGQEVASGWGLRGELDKQGPALMELTIEWRRGIIRDYTNNKLITIGIYARKKRTAVMYTQALDKLPPSLQMLLFVKKTGNGKERIKSEGKLPFFLFLPSFSIYPSCLWSR